jgi:hypothetical protein
LDGVEINASIIFSERILKVNRNGQRKGTSPVEREGGHPPLCPHLLTGETPVPPFFSTYRPGSIFFWISEGVYPDEDRGRSDKLFGQKKTLYILSIWVGFGWWESEDI